jgi:hypothetical protein
VVRLQRRAGEFIDVDDEHVIAVIRIKATGRSSGLAIERQDAMLYALADQQITGIDYYNSKQQALDTVAG